MSKSYLVVVLLEYHLEVETGKLAQVAVRPRLLRPEYRPDLATCDKTERKG